MIKITLLFVSLVLSMICCQDSDECSFDLDWEWGNILSDDWIYIKGTIENTSYNTIISVQIYWKIVYTDNTTSEFKLGGPSFLTNLPPGRYYDFDENAHIGDKSVSSVKLKSKDANCI